MVASWPRFNLALGYSTDAQGVYTTVKKRKYINERGGLLIKKLMTKGKMKGKNVVINND